MPLTTVDAELEKKRKHIRLKGDELMTLRTSIDRVETNVTEEDLYKVYSSCKGLTNYIERIARDYDFRPTSLSTWRKDNGVVAIVTQRKRGSGK